MKRKSTLIKGSIILFFALLFINYQTKAATYTATASGNFSAGATWGGTAPSFNLTSDQVIIPSGITVTLDGNLTLSGAGGSITVNGTLTSSSSYSVTLGALGTLSGSGTLNLGTLNLQSTAINSFSGSATVDTFSTAIGSLQLSGGLTVSSALVLNSGTLNLGGSSTLTMSGGSTIILAGGTLTNGGGGTLGLSASYSVVYNSLSATSGLELSGSGLNNLTVNVTGGNTVTLSSSTTVHGTLSLTSGTLSLNGNSLTLDGNIATTGSGNITANSSSGLIINTSGNSNGALNFTTGSSLGNLTVNAGSGNTVSIAGSNLNLAVNGNLTLTSGNISLNNDTITVTGSGTITGGSSSSYIVTSGNAALGISLSAGASDTTMFPVGTQVNFAPAALQLAGGSTSGTVYVTAVAGVLAQGTTGADLSATQPMVNTSWFIEPSFSGNVNMNINLFWSAAMQTNGFSYDSAYVSHYINGAWNTSAVSSASVTGSGWYELGLQGVTSFSPFAVFGNHVTTGINYISPGVSLQLYPNPTTGSLNLNLAGANEPVTVKLFDVTGNLVYTYETQPAGADLNTVLQLNQLTNGIYFVQIKSTQMDVCRRVDLIK